MSIIAGMCGVSGILDWGGAAVDRALLERMLEPLRHRGPDESGFHCDGGIGLAHARLSIIDPDHGHQPMANEDGSIWVVFNGEIFNYVELRQELIEKGHRFATHCDTEVLLHLYEEEGPDLVRRLNGQWAFALWDSRERRLLLSRDRLGIRPLFYHQAPNSIVFASEIKSLLQHPSVPREPDLTALDQILTFWVTLPPRTFFLGIHELAPGHSLSVERGVTRIWRHWGLAPNQVEVDRDFQSGQLRELLKDATRLRLRSDVPVGAYLSGGLDSTVTTALAREVGNCVEQTFSVSFEDAEFDERPFQQLASRELGTRHQELRCSNADICRAFPRVTWHAEKPVLRTAPTPLFLLSKLVRDSGFKVVVTGEGADETLGGYDLYKEAKIRAFCAAAPGSKLRPLLFKRLYPYLPGFQRQSVEYLKRFFRTDPAELSDPFFSHLPRWETSSMTKLFLSDAAKEATRESDPISDLRQTLPPGFEDWDYFSRAQYLESTLLLPGYILASQGDRMSMAHSVEGRFPFLDHRVVEFAFSLGTTMKMRGLNEKHLLKRAVGDLIPREIVRRKKQPFRAPDASSFFDPVSGLAREDYVDELLSEASLRRHGIFDPGRVGALVRKVRSGRPVGAKDNMALVGVLSTQLVMEQFFGSAGNHV